MSELTRQRSVDVFAYFILKRTKKYNHKVMGIHRKRKIGSGVFHCFGSDYEEFETGPGNYTTAIVEMPNGQVLSVPADMIKFTDIPQPPKAEE